MRAPDGVISSVCANRVSLAAENFTGSTIFVRGAFRLSAIGSLNYDAVSSRRKVTWVTKFLLLAAVIMPGTAPLANNLPKSAKSSDPSRDLHFRQSSALFKLVRGRDLEGVVAERERSTWLKTKTGTIHKWRGVRSYSKGIATRNPYGWYSYSLACERRETRLDMSAPLDCGIHIVHDRDGYSCGRLGSEACSDCGTTLCNVHAKTCDTCVQTFCDCCLYFHIKDQHVRKPTPAWSAIPERRSA